MLFTRKQLFRFAYRFAYYRFAYYRFAYYRFAYRM
jgi:hypothetical protein